jgi:hypothetical protein
MCSTGAPTSATTTSTRTSIGGILYEISFGGTKIHDHTLGTTVTMIVTTGSTRFNSSWGSDGAVDGAGIEIFDNSIDATASTRSG